MRTCAIIEIELIGRRSGGEDDDIEIEISIDVGTDDRVGGWERHAPLRTPPPPHADADADTRTYARTQHGHERVRGRRERTEGARAAPRAQTADGSQRERGGRERGGREREKRGGERERERREERGSEGVSESPPPPPCHDGGLSHFGPPIWHGAVAQLVQVQRRHLAARAAAADHDNVYQAVAVKIAEGRDGLDVRREIEPRRERVFRVDAAPLVDVQPTPTAVGAGSEGGRVGGWEGWEGWRARARALVDVQPTPTTVGAARTAMHMAVRMTASAAAAWRRAHRCGSVADFVM